MTSGAITASKPTRDIPQGSSTATSVPSPSESRRLDGRFLNKGSKKRLRYTMQFRFDMSEACDEAIHDLPQSPIKNATDYFNTLYASHDIAHK